MERVREALSRRTDELLDRWNRQLSAASDAGFALDAETAQVLPRLIEAADRALERRFRAIPPGLPDAAVEARRAAAQWSLLGDYLFDATLEAVPDMTAAQQRQLADALAHGAVEVLVASALQRETDRRRRSTARLARLAHDLRNSATAARPALDLLRRRGEPAGSPPARLLGASPAAPPAGVENTPPDEALSPHG